MSEDKQLVDVVKLRKLGIHCDAPQCSLGARWQLKFSGSGILYLCPRHKDETVAAYEKEKHA